MPFKPNIPKDWEKRTIKDVVNIGNGKDYKHLGLGQIPVYGTGGIMTYVDSYLYEGESVGIGRKGTIDKPVFLQGKFWTVDTLFFTHSFKNCLPKFLYYLFLTIDWKNYNEASGVPSLSKSTIELIDLLLPPLPEQQKIAAILSKWDEAIEAQTQLIEAKELQKKALMQKILTGEIRFPGFEEEWEEVTLNDICEFSNGKAHENIVDENGKYILITSKFISSNGELYRRLNERLTPLKKDDIVMVMSDIPNGKALGKCFLIDEDNLYSLNQRIGRFKITNGHPKFIFFLLNRNQHFLQFDGGVSQTNLRKDDILECPLYIPSFPEQQKIATVLSSIDLEIEALKNELEALQLQKKGLMQELLTGKIRVKV